MRLKIAVSAVQVCLSAPPPRTRSSSGSGSVGRASPCQGEGRGFESRLPLHSSSAYTRPPVPLALRLAVGQRTLDPRTEVRILEGQPASPVPTPALQGRRTQVVK